MKRLLLLDINGVLCRKVDSKYEGPVDLELTSYKIIYRPGYEKFLAECYERYDVGYYSSTTYKNADGILRAMLTKKQRDSTVCFWYRDRTCLDPDWGKSISNHDSWDGDLTTTQITKFSTVKYLSTIWQNPVINYNRVYSENNTIICDDSSIKLRFNNRKNCLLIDSFVDDNDTILETFIDNVAARFENL